MHHYISIGKVSILLGISISSLRRWDDDGLLSSSFRTVGGHRRYKLSTILEITGEVVLKNNIVLGYARVSGHKQKNDLSNQKRSIENYAKINSYNLTHIYTDIASGLNDQRINFLKLLRAIPHLRPRAVIITYKDRLARFGLQVIKLFCEIFSCELIIIHQRKRRDLQTELTEGVIAVITSYAGKFHRQRRGKILKNSVSLN